MCRLLSSFCLLCVADFELLVWALVLRICELDNKLTHLSSMTRLAQSKSHGPSSKYEPVVW